VDEKQVSRVEAIINSMTKAERATTAHQRQPPQAHCEGQRHDGRRRQSSAETVRRDAEDAQVDGGLAGGGFKNQRRLMGMLKGQR
jgi:hypothetical protein